MLVPMPTLTRYLRHVIVVAGLAYGIVFALANLVEPRTRQISEPIDSRIIRDAGRAEPAV